MTARIIRLAEAALAAVGAAWAARRSAVSPIQQTPETPQTPQTPKTPQTPAPAPVDGPAQDPRVSSLEEVLDGGYGFGSAAPIADGTMPLGHPVKAWEDTRTFATPGQDAYAAQPHVWFVDEQAAAAAGFTPAP